MRNLRRRIREIASRADQPTGARILQADRAVAKHLLVPIDFSEVCLEALPVALEMAKCMNADLTLVHVVTGGGRASVVPGLSSRPPPSKMMSGVGEEEALLKGVRENQLAEVENVTLQIISAEGHPAAAIAQHAKDMAMDMIVITTHGRSGFTHALMGSVTEAVIRSAPCPVLVVRASEQSE